MNKILILFIALLAVSFTAEPEVDEGVLVLTDSNFDEVIKANDKILVEFYAPWCGHCKKLAPEYAKAAKKLSEADPPVPIAKVDATEEKELASRFEVKGFPTLKWFVNGEPQEYKGGRTEDEIVNWVKKRLGPPTTVVDDDKLEELKKTEKFLVVFFGSPDTAEFTEFTKVAQGDDKHTFLNNPSSKSLPEGLSEPGIAIFRQFDEPVVVYKGDVRVGDLKSFISTSSVPTLIEFSEEYIEPIFQEQKPAIFLFIDKKNSEHEKLTNIYSKAAEAGKGRIMYASSGIKDGIQQRLAEYVGVEDKDLPRLMIIGFAGDGLNKYVYEGDVNAISDEDVSKFITKFENNELSKFLKSEDVPETQEGPVTVVVGKNFDDIVGKDDDVLIEFYAPWCGHCKALEPKYKELATELKDVKNLVIAKCDSTANEIDGISVSGFPTIKFFPKGKTTAEDYEGEREVDGFKKYLEEHSEAYKLYLAGTDL